MEIQLYLNNEEEWVIHTMNVESNPFKKGDIINLSVSDITPKELSNINYKMAKVLMLNNEERKKLFHLKDIKLIEENKYLDIETDKIIIEYFCEFI